MTREEEEEVRLLLSRHQERIMLDLGSTDLLAVLVKNSVLSQSEEDLLLKPYAAAAAAGTTTTATTVATDSGSAPSSVGALTKRKLSAVVSSSSGSGSGGSASVSVSGVGGDYSSSLAGSSRSASVNGDHAQSDNRSLTPPVGSSGSAGVAVTESLNDAEILRLQCDNLIDIIAKNGFEKFKQFCYAIECECPQLIEDLINDRLKNGK